MIIIDSVTAIAIDLLGTTTAPDDFRIFRYIPPHDHPVLVYDAPCVWDAPAFELTIHPLSGTPLRRCIFLDSHNDNITYNVVTCNT